ncbi:MAG: PQQ-binding-like beta-propeller repeat protein [Bacteroidales bacterium]|nr:PQQ-binding-like beta-propeller repeat protein [Bacteroidales bacterium]
MENLTSKEQTIQLLNRVAIISGIVAVILCILIIANYIQVKRVDPLNTPAMTVLLERLKSNPGDDALRREIRELDLLSRKAFFTSQWQIRTGGYILLACVLLVIICLKWIELIRPKIPPRPEPIRESFWEHRKINQRWIIYSGIFLVIGSLILAFLTYTEIGKTLQDQSISSGMVSDSTEPSMPEYKEPDSLKTTTTISANPNSALQSQEESVHPFPSRQEILNNSLTFRGPDGNGVVFQKNFPVSWDCTTGLNIKWKTQIPLPGNNSPIVWNERVFLSGANANKREVYCFDATTGKILWQTNVTTLPGTPSAVPKVDRETGLAAPTMTTDGQRIYAIFATGDLVALDMEGKLVWSKNLGLPKNHYGHSSSLIMYSNLLIVQWDQSQGASVKAFAGATGELVWNTPRDVRVSWASPILVNTGNIMELILSADPFVASYDPATGKERWRLTCIYGEVGPSVAYADGYLFATNEYAKLVAIKLGDPPQVAWESTDYLSDIPSPVANDKVLFLVTSYGVIVCYDAKTGEEYWIKELDNSTYASPVLVDDRLYQMDKTGLMHIFKADKIFTPVGEAALGEGSVCTPAFAGGKIFIRGDKNLYCIGK